MFTRRNRHLMNGLFRTATFLLIMGGIFHVFNLTYGMLILYIGILLIIVLGLIYFKNVRRAIHNTIITHMLDKEISDII